MLTDFRLIGQSIVADAASNVADRVRPASEDLDRVDEATPTHKFEDDPENVDLSKSGLKDAAINATGLPPDTKKAVIDDQPPLKETVNGAADQGDSAPVKKSFMSRFQALSSRVPDKHKQRANDELENGKQYLKDQFPKERRDQFVYRLKKVVVECQSHPSYQNSLSWFLTQIETYFGHGKRVASKGANQTSSLFSDPMLTQASSEMRMFLERCANGQSMDGMFNAAHALAEDAQNDEELSAWWSRLDAFVRKVSMLLFATAMSI